MRYPDGSETPITIKLSSARASGEILLSAQVAGSPFSPYGMTRSQLRNRMVEQSWRTFHRTFAVETARREFQLYHDAELLVGDEHCTTPGEIERFFERFTGDHDPNGYDKPTSRQTNAYWRRAAKNKSAHYGQWKAEISAFQNPDELGLTFTFGERGWTRKHYVWIYESEGRCIFLALAAAPDVVDSLSVDQLIKLTWLRNQHIDVVEFMLDEDMALIGRAVHPIEGMDYKEFIYCAYTLAAATDRLEFLIRTPDLH